MSFFSLLDHSHLHNEQGKGNGGGKGKGRKRQRKRVKKQSLSIKSIKDKESSQNDSINSIPSIPNDEKDMQVEVEYVISPIVIQDKELERKFSGILNRFSLLQKDSPFLIDKEGINGELANNSEFDNETQKDENGKNHLNQPSLSRKKSKKLYRPTIFELKQFAKHPEVVEIEDTTAKDPYFLVDLKCTRNTISIPRHWSRRRKYLAGKRGFVKPPFELPSFIKDTGIMQIRERIRSDDARKRQKVKAREKLHPKLGQMTVDYEKLYDAFFKYQTKPILTEFGDLYYEGKEFEAKLKNKKPGHLSDDLRAALGMTHLMPTPWLHSQQRYGPPPSYPHLRIPGLNAPIPEGAQWGYHPMGWGKPPMDNAFIGGMDGTGSVEEKKIDPNIAKRLNPMEKTIWGELEPDSEEEETLEEENNDNDNSIQNQ